MRWRLNVLRRVCATPISASRGCETTRHRCDVRNEDRRYRCPRPASAHIGFRSPGLANGETWGNRRCKAGRSAIRRARRSRPVGPMPCRRNPPFESHSFQRRRWRIVSTNPAMRIECLRGPCCAGSECTFAIDDHAWLADPGSRRWRDPGDGPAMRIEALRWPSPGCAPPLRRDRSSRPAGAGYILMPPPPPLLGLSSTCGETVIPCCSLGAFACGSCGWICCR